MAFILFFCLLILSLPVDIKIVSSYFARKYENVPRSASILFQIQFHLLFSVYFARASFHVGASQDHVTFSGLGRTIVAVLS